MLRALLSGLGWRKGIWGCAFSSWQPHQPPVGLLSATGKWSATGQRSLREKGIPEARNPVDTLWLMSLEPKQLSAVLGGGGQEGRRGRAPGKEYPAFSTPLRVLS